MEIIIKQVVLARYMHATSVADSHQCCSLHAACSQSPSLAHVHRSLLARTPGVAWWLGVAVGRRGAGAILVFALVGTRCMHEQQQ